MNACRTKTWKWIKKLQKTKSDTNLRPDDKKRSTSIRCHGLRNALMGETKGTEDGTKVTGSSRGKCR